MIDMNAFDRGFWNDALTASIMEEKYLRKLPIWEEEDKKE
jgi:hypothetical protein